MDCDIYQKDIGKFVTISYTTPDGTAKFAQGRLDRIENDELVIINISTPEKIKRVNPSQVKVADYSAEPLKVKG